MSDGLKDSHRETILAILGAHPGVTGAVLFGSRAMGTFTPESDIDICLLGGTLTLTDQARLSARLEATTIPQKVGLVLHRHIDSKELLDHIRDHGQVLLDKSVSWADRR